MKLSRNALILIILQTILTLGLNWLAFLIYYRLRKYSFFALNKDSNEYNNFTLFFRHKAKSLSIISIAFYLIYIVGFSLVLMLMNDSNFFYYVNFALSTYIKTNFFGALFLAVFIGLIFTYGYKILIKNVFYTIYQNNHEHFNNYSELDLYLFILFSIVSLGSFYLMYLFVLGIYDLYLYWINKTINKTKYTLSKFGIISLALISYIIIVLLYYIFLNHVYLNLITTYVLIIILSNAVLNYGMFEFKMRLFTNNQLELLTKHSNYSFNIYINKRVFALSLFVIIISVFISIGYINEYKEVPYHYEALNHLTKEETYDNVNLCYPNNYKPGNMKYNLWIQPPAMNANYLKHRELITSFINPEMLAEAKRVDIGYTTPDMFYTVDGAFYSYNNAYIYVQTYYKKVNDCYVPIFNIVKNLTLIASLDNYTIHLSIMNNNVYLYDFYLDRLFMFEEQYRNIDSTRLMIDELAIKATSPTESLYGYNIKDDTATLDFDSNNASNLENFILLFDFVPINETIIPLYKAFRPLDKKEIIHLTDIDLLTFRLFRNTEHLSFFNDRYFLYMSTVGRAKNINESYAFGVNGLMKCADVRCRDVQNRLYTNELEIVNLNKQSQMLYTDELLNNDDFKMIDRKIITLFDNGNALYEETVELSFTVKSIRQYFAGEYLSQEAITLIEQ